MASQNEKTSEKEPVLVFTGRVSRCAGGYHVKVRPTDVNALQMEGTVVRVELYNIEPPSTIKEPSLNKEILEKKPGTIEEETLQLMNLADSLDNTQDKDEKR